MIWVNTYYPLQRPTHWRKWRSNFREAVVVIFVALFATSSATADVYELIAENGSSHFSDQPSEPGFRLLLRSGVEAHPPSGNVPIRQHLRSVPRQFAVEIAAAAQASQLEPALLHAVVEIESGYNAKAVSPKGALGLMQLMPETARRYGVKDPLDAAQNTRGGARLLRDLLDLFSGNKELALAAYNAGSSAVLKHGRRIPPYPETSRYVPAVLKSYELQRSGTSSFSR